MIIESNPRGKKENSIRKPFPKTITKNTIKVESNIVVRVSIIRDKVVSAKICKLILF